MKKIENIRDYITASQAALILSQKYERKVRPDYISKMAGCQKHDIRLVRIGGICLYHQEDVERCELRAKRF